MYAGAGVVALLWFLATAFGLTVPDSYTGPGAMPRARADCPPYCDGNSGGSNSFGPNGSQFQPPQMPDPPGQYQSGANSYPGLDQNNGISLYNPGAGQGNEPAQGSYAPQGQPGPPANGVQPPNYDLPLQPQAPAPQHGSVSQIMSSQLMAQLDVFPSDGMVRIEDPGHSGPDPDITGSGPDFGDPGTFMAGRHSIRIVTMSAETAEDVGRNVTVRIYRGSGPSGLGNLIYSGIMDLTEPTLAIGEMLVGDEWLQRVSSGRTGPTRIEVYAQNTIQALADEPATPTDLNIVIE